MKYKYEVNLLTTNHKQQTTDTLIELYRLFWEYFDYLIIRFLIRIQRIIQR